MGFLPRGVCSYSYRPKKRGSCKKLQAVKEKRLGRQGKRMRQLTS